MFGLYIYSKKNKALFNPTMYVGCRNRSELRMRILLPIMSGQFVNIYIQYTNTLVRLCMYSFYIKELFENNYPSMLCVCILLPKNQDDVSMKSIDGLRKPFILPVFWHRSVQLDLPHQPYCPLWLCRQKLIPPN